MTRTISFMLGICLAAGTLAAQAPQPAEHPDKKVTQLKDPMEILKKAESALKKVRLARYKARTRGTSWIKAYVPIAEGEVMIGEPSEHDIERFRCTVKITPIGSEETIELTAGSDGDIYYMIDPQTKTVYADMDPAVMGSRARDPRPVLLRTLVSKEPLAEELKAKSIELKEDAEVEGEDCYQVQVTRPDSRELIWFISKRDSLPRRVDGVYKNPKGEPGTTELVLWDLVTEPTFRLAPFELVVPEGFTRSDDFAP